MTNDGLLAALDQLTNTIYWYGDRSPLATDAALVEALGDWVAEHSAEHNQPEPFTNRTDTVDELSAVLSHFLAAVAQLAAGARPELNAARALREALHEWVSAQSAEHHQDQPFQRPKPKAGP